MKKKPAFKRPVCPRDHSLEGREEAEEEECLNSFRKKKAQAEISHKRLGKKRQGGVVVSAVAPLIF